MLTLNSNLARMDDSMQKNMYATMDHGRIDRIFEKLRKCLSAVMVEKELRPLRMKGIHCYHDS